MDALIGKTISGIQTTNIKDGLLSCVTIFFTDGYAVSFYETWSDSNGWGGVGFSLGEESEDEVTKE